MSAMAFRFGTLTAVCGAIFASLAGCGGADTTTLTGTVTVHGTPLSAGTVVVRGEKGETALGDVRNGEYTVPGAPLGQIKIAVTAAEVPRSVATNEARAEKKMRMANNGGAGRSDETPKYVADIPSAYQDPESTPITHDTSSGSVKDIAIP